jgi:DNA (cytosine-5)-methyltransferase 1
MTKKQYAGATSSLTFADVFAGCGGLSLGLSTAGWKGRFAVEKHADAFGTFAANLVHGKAANRFDWPEWLPKSAITTGQFLGQYGAHLSSMKGSLTLLAGGPPCQGFSMAGRRTQSDPRNALTDDYIDMVKLLEPRFLLIENVMGFTLPFKRHKVHKSDSVPYSTQVKERLAAAGYTVYSDLVDLSQFGVPQYRKRFILIAIKSGDSALDRLGNRSPIDMLYAYRKRFLSYKGLSSIKTVSAREAIGDLETVGKKLIPCTDSPFKCFVQVPYEQNGFRSSFIDLMRKGVKAAPNSLRLPRHADQTRQQFENIMQTCTQGRSISEVDRKRLKLKKHALTPLHGAVPSGTVTTLPDDIIHYAEPRVLTARENARLQTFPDTFQFSGKYTTGGPQRKHDCPRYTQIGNAVPPLFAEAIGRVLKYLAA